MKKTALTYGLIAGGILATLMAVTLPLVINRRIDLHESQLFGYSSMVLAFLMVFLGIRAYRERVAGGLITFGKAFKVGILITLVASAVYVGVWEIIYWGFIPDFADIYAACVIDDMRGDGASAAEIAATQQQMAQFKVLYRNPLFNVGMTFLEVFPVGLVVTLVSAAILRKREVLPPSATTSVA